MHHYIHELIVWYQGNMEASGYWGIALMMAIESTFLPIPSELVIPIVAKHPGDMTLAGIILAGTIGSWVGASLMYWGSRWAGHWMLERYGWYFRLPEERLCQAEQRAIQFGPYIVFVTRLLPVVRHLIGVPAGMLKMNFLIYTIATLIGAAIWCSMLAIFGSDFANNPELLQSDLHKVVVWLFGSLTVIVLLYYFLIHPFIWDVPKRQKVRYVNPPCPHILSFFGRVNREIFWFTWAFILVMSFIARVVLGTVKDEEGVHAVRLCGYIVMGLTWAWIAAAVQAKRWHDLGKPGWMVCVNFIPVIGTLWSFGLLGFRPGANAPNVYGDEPAVASNY